MSSSRLLSLRWLTNKKIGVLKLNLFNNSFDKINHTENILVVQSCFFGEGVESKFFQTFFSDNSAESYRASRKKTNVEIMVQSIEWENGFIKKAGPFS